MHIESPMLFKISNTQLNISSHCGVLEFTAEEGMCLLPFWVIPKKLMNHLGLSEGDQVSIEYAKLQKGTFVKIQPHETAFIDLPNPRAVLENALRNYLCLTKGDSIVVEFAKKRYAIDIVETKPDNAIMTLQTDLQVDFAPPKDYREEPVLKKEPSITFGKESSKSGDVKTVVGYTLNGKKTEEKITSKSEAEEYDPRKHRIVGGIRGQGSNPSSTGNYWDKFKQGNNLKK
jgi:ubiquitin fusion degradation protein 1